MSDTDTTDRMTIPGWRAADHEELRAILHRVRIGLHTPLESARLAAVLQASLIAHVERLVPLVEWVTERIRPEDFAPESKP